jgi:hypothetical protein
VSRAASFFDDLWQVGCTYEGMDFLSRTWESGAAEPLRCLYESEDSSDPSGQRVAFCGGRRWYLESQADRSLHNSSPVVVYHAKTSLADCSIGFFLTIRSQVSVRGSESSLIDPFFFRFEWPTDCR